MNHFFSIEHDFAGHNQAELYCTESGFGFVTGTNCERLPFLKIPETNSGFVPKWWYGDLDLIEIRPTGRGCTWEASQEVLEADLDGRYLPLCYRQDVPRLGSYRITLSILAKEDADEVLIFAGRRRLAWRGFVSAGQQVTVTVLCDVSPIIPRGRTEAVTDLSVSFALVCSGARVYLQHVKIEETQAHTVYIMGDSTVTDQTGDFPYAPGASYSGWGQMLGAFLPEGYCVSNHAHSGLTTESFRSEDHWAVMAPLVKRGDLCMLQFGHNDQKLAFLQADGGYTERLEQYIAELRKLGALPVLVTPLARNSWSNAEQYNDLLSAYAEAVFRVGRRLEVPVLDLHGYAMEQIKAAGLEDAKKWFFPSDYTHTNDFGAYKMAAFLGKELCRILNIPTKLLPDWTPCAPLNVLTPPQDCTLTPPAGAADALAEYELQCPEAAVTRVECLEMVIQKMRFFPVNVYNDLYDDVLGHETYAGTVQCAAQNHMIPAAFVTDGRLYPDRPVTLQEFLTVLMPAYASRRQLKKSEFVPAGTADYAKEAVKLALGEQLVGDNALWDAVLTRKEAAALCRAVHI